MIISITDNGPPMLEKSMYDSWKSRMELYIENGENGRMILNSVQNGPLGLPPDMYAIVNHHKVSKEICDRVKLLMQGTKVSLQERECKFLPLELSKFVTDAKLARDLHTTNYDQLYSYLEQHEAHANETHLIDGRITVQQIQGRQGQSYAGTAYKGNATSSEGNNVGGKAMESGQILDEEQLAFLTDPGIPDGQAT
nr:hypothetical protein [Tanacetum cinerariifolium]